jgi:peroxiredoxin
MRLTTGAIAPSFEAQDWKERAHRLEDLRGHMVWLAFFRYASCPLCNLRVHQLIQRYDELTARDLRVLAVFQSPPASIARYVGEQEPPFPLLCDPEERLYGLYGLEHGLGAYVSPRNAPALTMATAKGFLPGKMEGTKTRIPADFLIDPEGVIQDVFYGSVIADHIPFERVERFLEG